MTAFSALSESLAQNYNHGQKSWDKYTFVVLFHTRQTNSSTLVQPLPLPPSYNVGHVYTLFLQSFNIVGHVYTLFLQSFNIVGHVHTLFLQSFNIVLGGGGNATHFKTDNSAFLRIPF